jgi:hypothetical protein
MYVHAINMYIYIQICTYRSTCTCISLNVCTWYIHVHDFISLYVYCTYMYINVNICLDTVQTRLCMFTTTLHFPSSPISLATRAASLSSAQEQLLLRCLLPGTSLFNRQTTQALLATPKLPQPLFHLIRIAAKPAIHCCSVTAVQKTLRSQTSDLLCLLHW